MDMTFRQVRSFIALCELQNFTKTAKFLNISQPTLTVHIHNIENALGVTLIDRSSKKISITPFAQELLPTLKGIQSDVAKIVERAREHSAGLAGRIRIGVVPTVAASFLPQYLSAFKRTKPSVTFVVHDVAAMEVLRLLDAGEIDIGISVADDLPANIEVLGRTTDGMQLVFPADHPLKRKRNLSLADLAAYPLILSVPGATGRAIVEAAFAAADVKFRLGGQTAHPMTALGMVRSGVGVAIIPEFVVEARLDPKLRSRPIKDPHFTRTLGVLRKRGRKLSPIALDFLKMLTKAIQQRASP